MKLKILLVGQKICVPFQRQGSSLGVRKKATLPILTDTPVKSALEQELHLPVEKKEHRGKRRQLQLNSKLSQPLQKPETSRETILNIRHAKSDSENDESIS